MQQEAIPLSDKQYTRPIMPYRSLPKRIKQMIEDRVDIDTFEYEIKRPRYGDSIQRGARKHYKEMVQT